METSAIVPVNTTPAIVSTHAPVLPPMHAIQLAQALSELAHKSGMSKARTPADAFFVIMYGYELGISPMTALRSIYSVGGAPSCSGEMMLALIRSSGKARKIRLPNSKDITDKAIVYMERADTGECYEATFSMKDAETAQLANGGNWKKYPKAMLLWRAVSICAKALFSDVIAGLYTVEEISPDTPVDETGAPTGDIVIEPPAVSTNGNGKAWYTSAVNIEAAQRATGVSLRDALKLLDLNNPTEFTGDLDTFVAAVKAKQQPVTEPEPAVTTANGEPVDPATGEILAAPAVEPGKSPFEKLDVTPEIKRLECKAEYVAVGDILREHNGRSDRDFEVLGKGVLKRDAHGKYYPCKVRWLETSKLSDYVLRSSDNGFMAVIVGGVKLALDHAGGHVEKHNAGHWTWTPVKETAL